MTTVVAPCSVAAARHAVEHWHYSERMPVGKTARFGVWEDDRFVGAILFAWGANHNLGKLFGLDMTECVELTRVAMRKHTTPVSQVVAQAIKLMHRQSPGLRAVVSFADPHQGHIGTIYQAGNWLYLGLTPPKRDLVLNGVTLNRRAYTGITFGKARAPVPAGAVWARMPGKHRYVMPLDRKMRRALTARALPYPTRGQGLKGEPSSFHDEGPGSIPGDRSKGDDMAPSAT